ncbi:MAG: hypothetical protein ACI9G5_001685 [Paracoccaceae bacterium]|jgi:hypothetical protein
MGNAKPALIVILVGLLGFWFYSVFTSLPQEAVRKAEFIAQSIEAERDKIASAKREMDALKRSDDWSFLESYAQTGDWDGYHLKAGNLLDGIATQYENDIVPILDRNHQDDLDSLQGYLLAARSALNDVKSARLYPRNRAVVILDGRKNKDKYWDTARSSIAKNEQKIKGFSTKVDEFKGKYPNKSGDFDKKLDGASEIFALQVSGFKILKRERASSTPDYAVYVDAYNKLVDLQEQFAGYMSENEGLLAQLDRSYVKVLSDQKIDYFVTVGRSNWCDGEYCGAGHDIRYPASSVDADSFEYFDGLGEGAIARNQDGWRSQFTILIPRNRWDALRIDPQYRWPRSEHDAQYWLASTEAKAFHKYTVIEDGEVNEGAWILVSSELFYAHEDNLGMAIATKPLGHYESETSRVAEPVGMAAIAEPSMVNGQPTGSNQYGEWRQQGGHSFWHYYGMYRLFGSFIGPSRYSYNDWSGYSGRNHRQPYYGRNNQYGTYGGQTYSNSRYRNSEYSKRNPGVITSASTGRNSGRTSSMPGSVRGAGAAGRARGPSSGGK